MAIANPDPRHLQAFRIACRTGATQAVIRLLDDGFLYPFDTLETEDFPARNETLLVFAIRARNPKIVEILADRGADVNGPDEFGYTALQHAVRERHPGSVQILLEHGADLGYESPSNLTVLFAAVQNLERPGEKSREEAEELLRLLVQHGAACDATRSDFGQILKNYCELCIAILDDDVKLVRHLVQNPEDAIFQDLHPGCQPAIVAARLNRLEIVRLFLDFEVGSQGILFLGVESKNLELVEAYLEMNLDPHITNDVGQTILHRGCELGDLQLVELLVDRYDFKIDRCDTFGLTPLIWALMHDANMRFGNSGVFDYLIERFEIVDPRHANNWKNPSPCMHQICTAFLMLMEHGRNFKFRHIYKMLPANGCNDRDCVLLGHFQKMELLSRGFVEDFVPENSSFWRNWKRNRSEYDMLFRDEVEDLKSVRITEPDDPGPYFTMFDFMFMDKTSANYFARQERFLEIYSKSKKDFTKDYQNFGGILNFQYHRACDVDNDLRDDPELSAIGIGVPEVIDDKLIDYFETNGMNR